MARWARRTTRAAGAVLVVACTAACAVTDPPTTSVTAAEETTSTADAPSVDRVPVDPRIVEASGMTSSGRDPAVVLIHNDSGDGPFIYRVGPEGQAWGRIRLRGIEPRDWEAIARVGSGENSRVFVGDIGDNRSSWPSISVAEFDEPSGRDDASVTPRVYRFRFEDGPRDAEALMVSPRTGRLYVVSKRLAGAAIYLAPEKLSMTSVNVLTKWRSAPAWVTDGAFDPDGSRYVLRTYTEATVFDSDSGDGVTVPLPPQPQGETVTWTPEGDALLVGSEGEDQRLWRVPVPR